MKVSRRSSCIFEGTYAIMVDKPESSIAVNQMG